MAKNPDFSFDYDARAADFAVPKQTYLAARPDAHFGYIATSTLVLDTSVPKKPRILLLQRAASDSNPNRWEPPGGACDDEDKSILHAAARELWEEAGLIATRIMGPIGDPHYFTLRDGRKVCQFNFVAHVKVEGQELPSVKLAPAEHQRYVWATEEEVDAGKVENHMLQFTSEEVKRTVLLALMETRKPEAETE